MDTSASGGMAPALQSTNHQSTDLVNAESHANGFNEVLPLETVNGSVLEKVAVLDKKLPSTTILNSTVRNLMPNGLSSGDASQFTDNHCDQSMTVKESFDLGKKKEIKSTVVPVHVGQGDCSLSHHNGWTNHKKGVLGGVLQENNSTVLNHLQNGRDLLGKEKTSNNSFKSPSTDVMPYKSTDGGIAVNENNPNGQNRDSSPPCDQNNLLNAPALPQDSLEITTAIAGAKPSKKCTKGSETSPLSSDSPALPAQQTLPNDAPTTKTESQTCLPCSNARESPLPPTTPPQTLPLTPELPQALKYTDLLNSDLLKLKEQVPNLSHKLANTLQELAASLKGSALPTGSVHIKNEEERGEYTNTVMNTAGQERHTSVKSLDFSSNVSPSQKDTIPDKEKLLQDSKLKCAIESSYSLQKRLGALRRKIDCIRMQKTARHVRSELHTIVQNSRSSIVDDSRVPVKNSGTSNYWLSSSGPQSKPENQLEKIDFTKILWRQVLTKRCRKSRENNLPCASGHEISKKRTIVAKNSADFQLKRENSLEQNPPSPGCASLDPIVQLTQVESEARLRKVSKEMLDKALASHGILLKELDFLLSKRDPDLTDSSSDEEVEEDTQGRTSKFVQGRASNSPTKHKFRKSLCKWLAERSEITKKWTWLQSRISMLEFSIREQGDIYRQLRGSKGDVRLDNTTQLSESDFPKHFTPKNNSVHFHRKTEDSSNATASPSCYVNQLLNNVHYQTTRLFDTLSPLSAGTPSPGPNVVTDSPEMLDVQSTKSLEMSGKVRERPMTAARTRPLVRSIFRRRKLVKLGKIDSKSEMLALPTSVPNDNAIVGSKNVNPCQSDTCDSFALKMALHDHSYHAVISDKKDIPLSMSMQACMKSNRKWCRKTESTSHFKNLGTKDKKMKQKNKKSKHKSRKKKEKKPAKSLLNHSYEDITESKKRRLSSITSETGRRRHRGNSFDSDLESSLVIGGFPGHPTSRGSNSGTSTPTHDNPAHHTNMKKKKSSEQAYDINNIVIPHGLTSARIEKLAYKEIQTPSWKLIEPSPSKNSEQVETDPETEEITQTAYKTRHDRYEILEKRKYMAYMEWSMSRRGRGSRMSSAGIPVTPDSVSPTPTFNPDSLKCDGDRLSASNTVCSNQKPAMRLDHSPPSPTSAAGVRTRRMSSDQCRPSTPLYHLHTLNHNISTSIQGLSSPNSQDCLGLNRGSIESIAASAVNARSLSDNVIHKPSVQLEGSTWELRQFPLQGEDLVLLENVDYALQKIHRHNSELNRLNVSKHEDVNCDNDISRTGKPVCRQGSSELQRTHESQQRALSVEALRDHQLMQHSKAGKRRRTDSRASSLATPDDPGRHSDASSASVSSLHKKRRKMVLEHGKEFSTDHGRSGRRHHQSYLELSRLSESDSSDNDSDDSRSTNDSSSSGDDAGHIVDDFADPEWDARNARIRI